MVQPKHIGDISVEDLKQHRWCYFYDDSGEYNVFEHVIPDTHPKFDPDVQELELALFRFSGGQQHFGSFDGSKSFCVFLGNERLYFWSGVRKPAQDELSRAKQLLESFSLRLPVTAEAKWSGETEVFAGIRYSDREGKEIEANI